MQVSKADKMDLEVIVKLNRLFHLDLPEFKWDTPQWVEEEIGNGNYYVIKNKSIVVAAICLKMLEEEGYIEAIAVQENKQISGFGRRLIEFAIEQSQKQGKSKLSVESFCDYGIEKFYEKCGFTRCPKLGDYKGHPYYCFSMNL